MKAVLITALGGCAVVDPADLSAMQDIVGGLVEPVCVKTHGVRVDVWVNEEGLVVDLPKNEAARSALLRLAESGQMDWYPLGDVFVTGCVDDDGETLPVPDGIARLLVQHVREWRGR